MKINRFRKIKNGKYEIELDHDTIEVHESLILKYNLLITKELDSKTLEKIRKENQIYDAYQVALKMLKTRMRSKKEIITALSKKGFSEEAIRESTTTLEKQGYLNDENYAIAYLHDKMNMSNDGPLKIRKSLELNGIEESIIQKVMVEFTEEIQNEKIDKIMTKEMKANHNKSSKMLLQKIRLQITNLGYDSILVAPKLEGYQVDEEEIKKKQYEKLYRQLSKKYSGNELEYHIRQKMYQKGFMN